MQCLHNSLTTRFLILILNLLLPGVLGAAPGALPACPGGGVPAAGEPPGSGPPGEPRGSTCGRHQRGTCKQTAGAKVCSLTQLTILPVDLPRQTPGGV
jgi:hypothetical protein